MIQNRRAYQLIHCRTHSRLLAGVVAVCGAACGYADLGLYHLLHRSGAPLPDSTQSDRAALAALCPKPATEKTCPPLPPQDPAVTLSVIVPVYNGEATIGPCLDSILQQDTGCTVQLIVVDSDSTDGTAAVLERYRTQPGMVLCNCSAPRSAAAARNEGLRHAVGRWLMFVDSDDLLLPGAIRILLDLAEHHTGSFIPMKEVAARQEISLKYIERIMPSLKAAGLVDSVHGIGGGYRLTRDPDRYTLWEILRLAEGDMAPVSCLSPGAPPCPRRGLTSRLRRRSRACSPTGRSIVSRGEPKVSKGRAESPLVRPQAQAPAHGGA